MVLIRRPLFLLRGFLIIRGGKKQLCLHAGEFLKKFSGQRSILVLCWSEENFF